MKPIDPEANITKLLTFVKVIDIIFLITVPLAVLFLIFLFRSGFKTVFAQNSPDIFIFIVMFISFSVICLILGLFWPKSIRRFKSQNILSTDDFFGQLIRLSFLESIVIYGIILKILGGSWFIIIFMFIVAEAALIIAYPKIKRLPRS